jgi:hypothetical protein
MDAASPEVRADMAAPPLSGCCALAERQREQGNLSPRRRSFTLETRAHDGLQDRGALRPQPPRSAKHLKAILILCVTLVLLGVVVLVGLRTVRATRVWPAALLIVTAPLEVYRSSGGGAFNVSLFRLALAVAVVTLAADVVRGRKTITQGLALPFVVYLALLAWQLISLVLVTPDRSLGYRFLGQYAGGLVAAFVITCYIRRNDLRLAAGLFGAGAILPLVAAAFRVFSVRNGGTGDLPGLNQLPLDPTIRAARQSGSFLLDGTQRLNATFSDPNHFGFYIATVLLVSVGAACCVLLFDKPIVQTTAASYVLLVIAAIIAVIGTYSRSSWLLAGVGLIVLFALWGRAVWNRQRVIAACVVALVAAGVASPLIVSRLSTSERGNVASTRQHEHTMSIALKLTEHRPLTGVGFGDYGRHAGQPALVSSAHSTFLTVAAELGLPGVGLLLAAIVSTSIAATKTTRLRAPVDRVILAGFSAAYVGLAVANTIYEVWMDDFQWVLFGLVLATTTRSRLTLSSVPFVRRAVADDPDMNELPERAAVM